MSVSRLEIIEVQSETITYLIICQVYCLTKYQEVEVCGFDINMEILS